MNKIDFGYERFKRVREVYTNWWKGKGTRPIVCANIRNRPAPAKTPDIPLPTQENISLNTPIDKLLDSIEYDACQKTFYGDGFPFYNLDCFGPGIMSAFLGARLDNSSGRVWFFPQNDNITIDNLKFEFDPDNPWLKYILDLCKKGYERFGDTLLLSMPDLGGIMDILSVFLPGEQLLYELYDNPEQVKILANRLTELWKVYFDLIAEALHSSEVGYTDWSGIYSATPSYIIQCDFSFMIGSDMFLEFVLPHLKRQTEYLDNTIYHLDGIKELNHLDILADMKDLNAIQWIPGTNVKPIDEWPEVFQKIVNADKGASVIYSYQEFENVINQTGRPCQLLHQQVPALEPKQEEYVKKWLKRFKVEL